MKVLNAEERDDERDGQWILFFLLLLLLTFVCVFSSTTLALRQDQNSVVSASMLAQSKADYGGDQMDRPVFGPLHPQVLQEATRDAQRLQPPDPGSRGEALVVPTDAPVAAATTVARLVSAATATARPSSTATPVPAVAASPTSTRSTATFTPQPVAAADTPSPTPLPTLTGTATHTPTPTFPPPSPAATATPLPPANTPQPASHPSPTPANPVPAATATPTASPVPTGTPTATTPPTGTASPTPTSTATSTVTPSPTATGTLLPTATPTATATRVPLLPILECVSAGRSGGYIAHFGYHNSNGRAVTIPVSSRNRFTPSPGDRGQPVTFEPGWHASAFTIAFKGTPLNWILDGNRVQARADTPACP